MSPQPWWITIDSDVQGANISSTIPAGGYLGYPGSGGYPGIPVYSSASNLTSSTSSQIGWIASSGLVTSKTFNYNYFSNSAPDTVVFNTLSSPTITQSDIASGVISPDGYYWYKYVGNGNTVNITEDIDIGNRKVIIFLEESNLNIGGKINLTDGVGFILTVVDGNLTIDPAVGGSFDTSPDIEGIVIADGTIDTGSGTNNLHIRGSIVGNTGVAMSRDLDTGNESTPAEVFEYAPDQILLFPSSLGYRKIDWNEVAP
jgi:hypothetical protein